MVLQQIPIRLEIDLVSTPPVAPIDRNTGNAPRFWRGQTVAIEVGIFDASGNPVDLSNLASLQAVLQPSQNSPYAVVSKTLLAVSNPDPITTLISILGWRNGTQQNATFVFAAADTDQGLGGLDSAAYWLIVQGTLVSGAPVIFSAGVVYIDNAGSSLPVPNSGLTSRHAQTTNAGDFAITPTSQLHKEIVTVTGAARTSNAILGINNVQDGAELTVVLVLTATPGITIEFRSGLVSNPILVYQPTGTVLQCRIKFYFDADLASWVNEVNNIPSP